MIRMRIRIIYGKLKFKIRQWFSFDKIVKLINAIKILELDLNSFLRIYFSSKNLKIITLSENSVYSKNSLKEIAIMSCVYNNIIIHNDDYSENSVAYRRFINKYYLKLMEVKNND